MAKKRIRTRKKRVARTNKSSSSSKGATRGETIANIPLQQVAKLKGNAGRAKLISYVKAMRVTYRRRVASFKKNGLISQAQIALERDKPEKSLPLEKMTRNQLLYEFHRYATFFQAKSSTIKGIIELNNQQDARLFGLNAQGIPNHRMSEQDRINFWNTYEEYKNQYPADLNLLYSSEQIQQSIADALFGKNSIKSDSFIELLHQIKDILIKQKESDDIIYGPNVFTGRWDDFTW